MRMKSFSIRSLLIFTLLVAVFLALPLGRAVNQKSGREWVANQRGHVFFEHEIDDEPGQYSSPYVPQFFIRLLGVDFFDPVRCVVFDCDELVDLRPITRMPTLHTIVINIEMADDIDLSPMEELPNLKEVHFTEWSFVTKEQIDKLRRLMPHAKIISETHGDGR